MAAAQIVQATKDKAQGIIGDATLQAGSLINTAKEEASRINEKSKARAKELDRHKLIWFRHRSKLPIHELLWNVA